MQSKISFSNFISSTVFFKNIKRSWPLWAGYTFLILWMFPGILYFNNIFGYSFDIETTSLRINREIIDDYSSISLWISLFMGIIFAEVVFNFLQTEKSCYFMHSLPLTRRNLFISSFVSGYAMMLVPNILAFVCSNLICMKSGVNGFKNLCIWFLIFSIEELFFFSAGIFCMVIIGNSVFAVVVYAITIFFVSIILFPINSIYRNLYYGIDSTLIQIPREKIPGILSPIEFMSNIDSDQIFDNKLNQIIDYKYNEHTFLIVSTVLVAGLIFLIMSFILYKIRKSENSGEFVAHDFMHPVFGYIVGISNGLLMAWLIQETLLTDLNFEAQLPVIVGTLIVLFSAVGYIVAEMLMRKSVRVFKACGKKLLIFVTVVLLMTVGLLLNGKKNAITVPKQDTVQSVYFRFNGYGANFEDISDINSILSIHQVIVDNYDRLKDEYASHNYYSTSYSIRLDYYTDKKIISRTYLIPGNEIELRKSIYNFANENLLRLIFGNYIGKSNSGDFDYDALTENHYYISGADMSVFGSNEYEREYITFDSKEAIGLLNAIIRDIDEGNFTISTALGYSDDYLNPDNDISKVNNDTASNAAYENIYGGYADPAKYPYYEYNLNSIDFRINSTLYPEYEYMNYALEYKNICFNGDCVHTVEFLNNCGKIPQGYKIFLNSAN